VVVALEEATTRDAMQVASTVATAEVGVELTLSKLYVSYVLYICVQVMMNDLCSYFLAAAAEPSFHMHNNHHHMQNQQISKSQQQLLLPGNNNYASGGLGAGAPLTPTNRLRRNISITNACFSLSPNSSYSRSSSVASFCWRDKVEDSSSVVQPEILCRLCLCNVRMDDTVEILGCSCRYCKDVSFPTIL